MGIPTGCEFLDTVSTKPSSFFLKKKKLTIGNKPIRSLLNILVISFLGVPSALEPPNLKFIVN